jgi:hypothetical protein
MSEATLFRRVVLLETDERAGLVAALTLACANASVSLDITTGTGHVLLTFSADTETVARVQTALASVPGVRHIHLYQVIPPRTVAA